MILGFATNDWAPHILDDDGDPTPGGAGWARIVGPASYIARGTGHDVVVGTLSAAELRDGGYRLLVRDWQLVDHDVDVIVLQRWMNQDLPDIIESARKTGQIVVNDVDDHFFGLDRRNNAYRATDPSLNPENNRDHYRRCLAQSDLITVSTPWLAAEYRRLFPKTPVALIENAIDLARYEPRPLIETDTPTIGWVGATPYRSGDLESLKGTIGEFCNRRSLTFHHSGRATADEHIANGHGPSAGEILGVALTTDRPMCSVYDYPEVMFNDFDIGIVPLADVPFNYAKSWIKGLEYAAAGIPFVASRVGEYPRLLEHGIGRTARAGSDWLRELGRMLDTEWRADQRLRNLEAVKQFDLAHRWQDWVDVYERLV